MLQVLQIEFNELSPELLNRFMSDGRLPNFRRFYEASDVFLTDSRAEAPHLEPWIQWPTVHYGVSHLVHGLRHLGVTDTPAIGATDAEQSSLVPLAKVLSDAGVRVGVLGAMNVRYENLEGFNVPDPWNTRSRATPDYLSPYVHTVGTMVRDSSRTSGESPGAGLPAFAAFLLRNGLSAGTVRMLLRQLVAERRDPGIRWRRATALDWLQYDIFRRLVTRERVQFASFFSNSTAHYMHYFWRHMDPHGFVTAPDPEDHPSLGRAVLFGYQSMDRLLGRIMKDFPDARLVFCTALSQEPWTDATKQTYRPRSWDAVLRLAGYSAAEVDVTPIMAEQFVVHCKTVVAAREAKDALSRLTVDGAPLMRFDLEDRALVGGCAVNHAGAVSSRIAGTADSSRPLLGDVFVPIHTVRSGRHSSEGALWLRTGRHAVHPEAVDLEDIAPTVLNLFGVPPAQHMSGRVLPLTTASVPLT